MTENQFIPESVLNANNGKLEKFKALVRQSMPSLPYHNFGHAQDAASRYKYLAREEGLKPKETFLGISAMIAHDVVSIVGAKDNEEKSIDFIKAYAPECGYLPDEIELMGRVIYVTKVGVEPVSLLEKIAKDADTDNFGRKDFFEKNEALRQEYGSPHDVRWLEFSANILKSQRYYTNTAKKERNRVKFENIAHLQAMIDASYDIACEKTGELLDGGSGDEQR